VPRHIINFSDQTKFELEAKIQASLANVKFSRYGNEPNYTPAMVQQLNGLVFHNEECVVKIEGAVMTSVSSKSVEKWSGADCSIVAQITDKASGLRVEKGILTQCKRGSIAKLTKKERKRLKGQIENMRKFVQHPKVIETPEIDGETPIVISGIGILNDRRVQRYNFGRWIARRVLPTYDGDTREGIADMVLDHSLSVLKIFALKS